MSTADRLNEVMEKNNYKQIDLIRIINDYAAFNNIDFNIGKSAMSQYLSGKVVPKQDKIYVMAKALKVSPQWLMGYDMADLVDSDGNLYEVKLNHKNSEYKITMVESELIKKYRALDPAGKDAVDSILESQLRRIGYYNKNDSEVIDQINRIRKEYGAPDLKKVNTK
mgnify:CR=1 FL=1